MTTRPNSRVNLDKAIERLFGNYEKSIEVRSIMANALVGQMLKGGVVKGGSGLKLRYGLSHTRATMDLDTACAGKTTDFVAQLTARLREGWQGFTGTVIKKTPAQPRNVPSKYVMQPYAIRLSYNGQSWCSVDLEIGFNEIGDADEGESLLSNEVADIFTRLGFSIPDAIPLMKCEHQVAQKLHGLTEPNSHRAHDLIDLQLILDHTAIDFEETARICRRLFAFRRMQSWPPQVIKGANWEALYKEANQKSAAPRTLDEAITWANSLIAKIEATTNKHN